MDSLCACAFPLRENIFLPRGSPDIRSFLIQITMAERRRGFLSWDIQKLFRRHAAEITRSLRRRGLTREAAEDLMQDTFLRVMRNPPGEAAPSHNPRAYLFRVSRNLSIDLARRDRLMPRDELDDAGWARIADPSPLAEHAVYERRRLQQVAEALAAMPPRTRAAFILYRLEGCTIREIAQRLEISPTRAWTLVQNAYRHLRDGQHQADAPEAGNKPAAGAYE